MGCKIILETEISITNFGNISLFGRNWCKSQSCWFYLDILILTWQRDLSTQFTILWDWAGQEIYLRLDRTSHARIISKQWCPSHYWGIKISFCLRTLAWHKAMERIGRPEHMWVDIILMSWGTEESTPQTWWRVLNDECGSWWVLLNW